MLRADVREALQVLGLSWDDLSLLAAAGEIDGIREVIKSAYRKIAKRTHPDARKNNGGVTEFSRAKDARRFLMSIDDTGMFRKPFGIKDVNESKKLDQVFELLDFEYFGMSKPSLDRRRDTGTVLRKRVDRPATSPLWKREQ